MLNELPKRYKFVRCSHIPATECNGANFRSNLLSLHCCPCSTASQWSPATTLLCTNSQRISHFNGDISQARRVGALRAKDLIVAEICSILSTRLGYCRGALKPDKLFHGISHGGTSRIQSGVGQIGFHCWVKQRSIPWLRRKRLTDFRFQIQSVGLELSSTGFIYFEYI